MNKNRKTSHILNVFQYDVDGHVVLPASLTLTVAPASNDNSGKVGTTAWVRSYVSGLNYLTGNQSITVSGDATGSGTTAITLTLANTAVTPGTYGSTTLVPVVTVDSKGRITSVTTAAISGSLTFTGDVTGSGTTGTSTGLTLAASGVTAGTYTKVTVDSKGRVTVGANASTTDISEGTNLYYTDTRVGTYLTANSYATQSYVGTQVANLVAAAPATLDTLNELAAALGNDPSFATTVSTSIGTKVPQTRTLTINGTGYDLSADRSWTINSMVYPGAGIALSTGTAWGTSITDNSANWNTAYGWGNHAIVGYLTSVPTHNQAWSTITSTPTTISGYGITNAYTDAQIQNFFNGANAITGYNKSNWDTAYGWGNHASGGYLTGITSSQVTTALGYTPYNSTNPSGYITGITSSNVTTALGYTPYNSTNPSGYITTSSLTWSNISGKPTTLSSFTNDLGNYGGWITGYTETDTLASVTGRGATTSNAVTVGLLIAQGPGGNYNENVRLPGSTAVISFNTSGATGAGSYNIVSQTNFQIRNAGGTQVFVMDQSGNLTMTGTVSGSNLSGTNTGDQTNISGNAATVTNGLYTNNYSGTLDGRYFFDYGFTTGYPGTEANAMPGNRSAFTYSNGAPLTGCIAHFGAAGYGIQLNGDYGGDSFSMRSRNGDNATWRPWKRLLTDYNYNSYSPTLTGTGASGTWGISISGSAGSVAWTNVSSRPTAVSSFTNDSGYLTSVGIGNMTDVHRLFNNMGNNHGTYQDFNSVGNFGVRYMQGSTNGPESGQHYGFTLGLGNDYSINQYATQFYWLRNTTNPYIRIRYQEGGSWGGWTKVSAGYADTAGSAPANGGKADGALKFWATSHPNDYYLVNNWTGTYWRITSNHPSGVQVAYADSAGSAPASGGNSSTVGGYSVDVAGSANTIPTRNASGYLIPQNWIQLNGIYGLYSPTNSAHFYPNNSTYGSWKSLGDRNGWRGIHFGEGTGMTLMMNETEFGFHREAHGWYARFTNGRFYGACDNVYNLDYALGNTHYWTAVNYFQTNNGGQAVNNSNTAKLEAYSTGNNSAFMSFHKGGYYAVNFGLDDDNVMRIGGWSAGANRWQLDMSGNMTVAGDVTAYSDARVKENISTIENALSKVLTLRGVSYNRIDSDDKKTKIGVIAQEILQIVPEVVNQDNDGMFNVSYGNLAGLFIEAFKEQQKEIEELKTLIYGITR